MRKRIQQVFLSIVLVLSLAACNLELVESPADADVLLTITANAALIEAGQAQPGTEEPLQLEGDVAPPADEVVLPAEVLPPAVGDVTVTVSVATNCRQGPGAAFASVYGMPVGQVAKVVAQNKYSGYWIIEIPGQNGQSCWLWGKYATINGDTTSLKDVATPTTAATLKTTATATATFTPAPGAIAGCTNSTASNYNPAATVDDGSCFTFGVVPGVVVTAGCMDTHASNYNPAATQDDGSCVYKDSNPPTVDIVRSSVICNLQPDGSYQFIIEIHWTDKTYAPNDTTKWVYSYVWRDINGASLGGAKQTPITLSQSPWQITEIRPAGAEFHFSIFGTNTRGNSEDFTRLTCP